MRILLSGASGFVGGHLRSFLQKKGHEVIALVRGTSSSSGEICWDPVAGKARKGDFEGFDAVFHLAGAPLVLGRWTAKVRKEILYSRTVGTWFLSQILSSLYQPPPVVVTASAVGYYGDRGEEVCVEGMEMGETFLAAVCKKWEEATEAIQNRGSRVVHARLGMVVSPEGGVIRKVLPLYKAGLGAILGTGEQWVSWIALDDLLLAMEFFLEELVEGAVNCVSSHPLRQKEWAHEVARFVHRPLWLRVPSCVLRGFLGTSFADFLLSSAKALPTVLEKRGFVFTKPCLTDALSP